MDEGIRLARNAGDPIGEALLGLAGARISRLMGTDEHRMSMIEHAPRVGEQFGDEAVLAHAFTTLGDELAAQGEREAALYRYRDVRHLLDGSDVPALGVWALRAEHRIVEQMDQ